MSGGLITGAVESGQQFLRGCAEKVRNLDAEGDEQVQWVLDQFAYDMFEARADAIEKTRNETLQAEKSLGEDEDTDPPTVIRT